MEELMPFTSNTMSTHTTNLPAAAQNAKDPVTSAAIVVHTNAPDVSLGAQDIRPPTVLSLKKLRKHGREVKNGQGQQIIGVLTLTGRPTKNSGEMPQKHGQGCWPSQMRNGWNQEVVDLTSPSPSPPSTPPPSHLSDCPNLISAFDSSSSDSSLLFT